MKRFLIDANALLRFLLNDIPSQKKAFEKLLQEAKRKEVALFVPQIVIFEIDFILEKYYQFSKEEIINKLKSIISTSYIQVQDKEYFKRAIELYAQKNISFADCFLLSKAKIENAELFTFDRKIKKLGKMHN